MNEKRKMDNNKCNIFLVFDLIYYRSYLTIYMYNLYNVCNSVFYFLNFYAFKFKRLSFCERLQTNVDFYYDYLVNNSNLRN